MNRYTVTEVRAIQGLNCRVFSVRAKAAPEWLQTEVWYGPRTFDSRDMHARCTGCSGIMSAMSGSCAHANAVKRFVKRNG